MSEPKTPWTLDSLEGQLAFIEAVLFVSKDPVAPERFYDFFNFKTIKQLEVLLEELDRRLIESHRGLCLQRAGGGLQLVTRADIHEGLKEFFTIRSSSRLSLAALESLAIVSYRQPVTIAEISDMRGVNSTGAVKTLLQKKLIKITGRKKVPGRPAMYGTTKQFLLYFGLNDLSELPSLEELTEMFEEKEQPSLFTM
jgi:segregation and condensation protein B